MEQLLKYIQLNYSDPRINNLIKRTSDGTNDYSVHFNQGEELFLKLSKQYVVPPFSIHHDVREKIPSKSYLDKLFSVLDKVIPMASEVFSGLTYFFDPTEILRPCFYHIYKVGDILYLYLMRLDFGFRPNIHRVVNKGTNDTTAEFETNILNLEIDIIPLESVELDNNKITKFIIKQSISQTWIGETGRGYFVQGIWLDREITKFFSKLFIPQGKKIYPYYPLNCKYRAICHQIVDPSLNGRKRTIPFLHKAIQFLTPHINEIQESLKSDSFSESLDQYLKIKQTVPQDLSSYFDGIDLKLYLNDLDMKEWQLEFNYFAQ